MSLSAFLEDLRETGRVRVPVREPDDAREQERVESILLEMDAAARLEMPGEAPPLSIPAARWAAETLFQACRFLVHREVDGATVARGLARPCPESPSPAAVHSADLALRHLPDVLSLARGIAPADPLVAGLLALARAWPFSSPGVPDVGDVDVSSFVDDPCLLQAYADRVIESRNAARLGDPRVREAVEASIGIHPDLAPEISAALKDARDP